MLNNYLPTSGYLEETDKFLETYNLPRLSHEEIESLSKPVNKEIDSVSRNLPTKKSPGPDGFTSEFNQTFQEELMTVLLKFFQKIKEERTLPNLFFEALIPMPDTDTVRKEN